MSVDQKLDTIILWTDNSYASIEAERLLVQSGIEFQSQKPNVDSPLAPLDLPSLQTRMYRYSGIELIRALSNKSGYLADMIGREETTYLAMVELEDQGLLNSKSLKIWPDWSVRRNLT